MAPNRTQPIGLVFAGVFIFGLWAGSRLISDLIVKRMLKQLTIFPVQPTWVTKQECTFRKWVGAGPNFWACVLTPVHELHTRPILNYWACTSFVTTLLAP